MKNRIISLAALILVSYGMSGVQTAEATFYKTPGIRGSDHDFANRFGCYDSVTGSMKVGCVPWANAKGRPEDEICIFCHTPHHANTGYTEAPLWNRAMPTATYIPYQSPQGSMKATVGQPTGLSKLCLSCHDGTVAIDAYGTNAPGAGHTLKDLTGGVGGEWGNAGPNLGTDLTTDHPVSFTYDAALASADPGVFDPTAKTSFVGDKPANPGLANTITVTSILGSGSTNTIKADMLDINNQVQCTSCHDAHNKFGWNKFLVKNNTGSGLCLTCHNK